MDKTFHCLEGTSLTPGVLWFNFLKMIIMQTLSFMHVAFRLFYLNNKTRATSRDVHIAGVLSFFPLHMSRESLGGKYAR